PFVPPQLHCSHEQIKPQSIAQMEALSGTETKHRIMTDHDVKFGRLTLSDTISEVDQIRDEVLVPSSNKAAEGKELYNPHNDVDASLTYNKSREQLTFVPPATLSEFPPIGRAVTVKSSPYDSLGLIKQSPYRAIRGRHSSRIQESFSVGK